MKKNNFQKGGFIYESLFLTQDNPNFNLINAEITTIKNTNKNIYNKETQQFYEEPIINRNENLLLLQALKAHQLENHSSIQSIIEELRIWKLENKITENESKLTIILEIRRHYNTYTQNSKPVILDLLIREIKKIYPTIPGSNNDIYQRRNWGTLSLDNISLRQDSNASDEPETGAGPNEASLVQIIELRKQNESELSKNQRQLSLIKTNILKINTIIESVIKARDTLFKLNDLEIDVNAKREYNEIYDEYFRNDASLLELSNRYKSVFSNIVPIYKDNDDLQFFPFFKNNYRIYLGQYGVHIWEIYSHSISTIIPPRKILMDFNFRITNEIDPAYRERFIYPKKSEDFMYFLNVNKNVNFLEYHLLNTNRQLLPELFIFYKKYYGSDFMDWFNLYGTITESNQILYHQKPNIMSSFILSNSINLLLKIYSKTNSLTHTLFNKTDEASKRIIETEIIKVFNTADFTDKTVIKDYFKYLDSRLRHRLYI